MEGDRTARLSLLQALTRRPSVWFGIIGSAVVATLAVTFTLTRERAHHPERDSVASPPASTLPVLSQVPAFEFIDQRGQAFSSASLVGRVWVANFIFTRCPTVCPPFSARMARIQAQSRDTALRLVTFTVDPEFDTPPRLLEYSRTYRADEARWSFLTAARPELERVIVRGMMQPMDPARLADGGEPADLAAVVHGSSFALVDQQLQVRGFYKFDEPGVVEAVVRDARALLREPSSR